MSTWRLPFCYFRKTILTINVCRLRMFNLQSFFSDSRLRMFYKSFWILSYFFGKREQMLCLCSVEKCSKSNRRPCFGSARIAHLRKLWEKRYSSSLKVVKETVRKCRISQKSWCVASCIRNFRDKNGDVWKSFDFFDTQFKTRSGSDYACSRESTLRSVPLLLFDPISVEWKMLMQILY